MAKLLFHMFLYILYSTEKKKYKNYILSSLHDTSFENLILSDREKMKMRRERRKYLLSSLQQTSSELRMRCADENWMFHVEFTTQNSQNSLSCMNHDDKNTMIMMKMSSEDFSSICLLQTLYLYSSELFHSPKEALILLCCLCRQEGELNLREKLSSFLIIFYLQCEVCWL